MLTLGKDVLGIVILKLPFVSVLNLRATCKNLNEIIKKYNKYWFLRWIRRKYRFIFVKEERYSEIGQHIGRRFELEEKLIYLPLVRCVHPNISSINYENLKEDCYKSQKYNVWKNNFKETGIPNIQKYEDGYCVGEYCKSMFPEHICKDIKHYSVNIDEKYLDQSNIGILHEKILKFFNTHENYFENLLSYKPEKHIRCNNCKCIYEAYAKNIDEEWYLSKYCNKLIYNNGIETGDFMYFWTSGKPNNLKKGDKICDACFDNFVNNKILSKTYKEN
jgi:hypothetical protein